MKRDWTIIRTILCDVEKLPVHKGQPYSQDEDGDDVAGHALMLVREGYIYSIESPTPVSINADSLTMRGHDLLAQLRNGNGKGPAPA